jgi:hypothetical protein
MRHRASNLAMRKTGQCYRLFSGKTRMTTAIMMAGWIRRRRKSFSFQDTNTDDKDVNDILESDDEDEDGTWIMVMRARYR